MPESTLDTALAALRWVGEPAPSPAGDRVAYVETWLDHAADAVASRVGVVPAEGGATVWLGTGHSPRWAPDGRRLALCRRPDDGDPGSGDPARLWLVEPDAGAGRWLTPMAPGDVSEPAWSPDGTRLAFTRTERVESIDGVRVDGLPGLYLTRRRVEVVDVHGNLLWTVGGDGYRPQWSPDGSRLAFLTSRFGSRPDLCWTDAAGLRPPVRVSDGTGPVRGYAWSPDGTRLAYLAHRYGDAADVNLRLWQVGADGGEPVELTRGWRLGLGNPVRGDDPRGTGDPPVVWSAATGRVYVEVAAGGRGPLAWFEPGSARSGTAFDGEHACLTPSVGGGLLAFVRTGPGDPGDVHVARDCAGGTGHGPPWPVTAANPGLAALAAPTVELPASAGDGTAVDAWLTALPGGGARPLLVNVHGGPHGAVGWRFTAEVQRMAARGYAVLTLNPRGSQGYGEDFARAIRGGWGGVDLDDVFAAVDVATRLSTVDGNRVAVWGVSYGGFMAQWAITRTDRFAAAVSENGLSDFVGVWGTGAGDPAFWDLPMGGAPWSSRRLLDCSPLAHADRVATPLLLVHAQDDQVCPVAQSEQAHAALRTLGRRVELVRIPGEGHLMNLVGRPSSRRRRAEAIDGFLARHLTPGGGGSPRSLPQRRETSDPPP